MNTHRTLAACTLIATLFLAWGWQGVAAQPNTALGAWQCWTPPGTVPCNHHLHAVDALSETDGWAVGTGAILRDTGPAPTEQVFLPLVTLEQEVRHAREH